MTDLETKVRALMRDPRYWRDQEPGIVAEVRNMFHTMTSEGATMDKKSLSVLAYANGFTLWHYPVADSANPDAPGFFDAAADMLRLGDMIILSGAVRSTRWVSHQFFSTKLNCGKVEVCRAD